ncbi:MAG: hypothetical protein HRU28_05005 [Rhizobiales bacterium]|nr:hypothetical protein [Hyphomicrobiales bacterium]
MNYFMKTFKLLTLFSILILTGCSTIPREATCKCFKSSGEPTGLCKFAPLGSGIYVAGK